MVMDSYAYERAVRDRHITSPPIVGTSPPREKRPCPTLTPSQHVPAKRVFPVQELRVASPAASEKSESDEDDAVEAALLPELPSALKRAKRTLEETYPSPTPTPTSRRAIIAPVDDALESERDVVVAVPTMISLEDEDEDDELDVLPPIATPTKSNISFTTPTKTSERVKYSTLTRSDTPTKRQSSNRQRNLPPQPLRIVNAATARLSTNLIGYEDKAGLLLRPPQFEESDSDDIEFAEDGITSITPSRTRAAPTTIERSKHSTALFLQLFNTLGARLCSARHDIPRPELPQLDWNRMVVDDYPTLEGLGKWEKEVRYAVDDVVGRGVGNCIVLLGQRGVGKTLVSSSDRS